MPLSHPKPRRPKLVRRIECSAHERVDELWDVEAHLVDTAQDTFTNAAGVTTTAGQNIHDMSIRLTIDADLMILDVECVMDVAPWSICPAVTPNFDRFRGVVIGPGFRRQINESVGGRAGCAHLREMMGRLANTAMQVRFARLEQEAALEQVQLLSDLVNTCHAFRDDREVVERFRADMYVGAVDPRESADRRTVRLRDATARLGQKAAATTSGDEKVTSS